MAKKQEISYAPDRSLIGGAATAYRNYDNKAQRSRYRSRHRKDLSTGDPTRAGYLSWHILWGSSTSRRENIASYKRRFGFNS